MFSGGHNAEYEAFMAEMAPVVADAKNLVNSARVQLEKVAALESRISDLERIGRRVEKEIGR